MEVKADKESRCAVSVDVSKKSSVVYVLGDMDNRSEGHLNMGGVVYC